MRQTAVGQGGLDNLNGVVLWKKVNFAVADAVLLVLRLWHKFLKVGVEAQGLKFGEVRARF